MEVPCHVGAVAIVWLFINPFLAEVFEILLHGLVTNSWFIAAVEIHLVQRRVLLMAVSNFVFSREEDLLKKSSPLQA